MAITPTIEQFTAAHADRDRRHREVRDHLPRPTGERPMSTTTRRAGALLASYLCLLATACTGSEESTDPSDSDGAAGTAESPCAPQGDETQARALLRCGEQSVVFIETPFASGTGIVIDQQGEQYVVTNLHVVDPFGQATLALSDGESLGTVPLVGAEASTDIAVLGPIEGSDLDVAPVPLEAVAVEKGDEVFIVGYPGTANVDEVDLTITSGLVSRRRELPEWDQTYVQTDAVVEDGQSGGPMFAGDGGLVGITALAFDESFSLALATSDVSAAVGRILDDGGDDLTLVPISMGEGASGGETTGTIEMPTALELPTLFLPSSDEDRSWNLTVEGPGSRFGVTAIDALEGEVLAQSAAGVALGQELLAAEAAAAGLSIDELAGAMGFPGPLAPAAAAAEVTPGSFRIEVPAGVIVEVYLQIAPDASPATLTWTSDQPMWPLSPASTVEPLELDQPVDMVLSSYQFGAVYDLELEEGVTVQVVASSPWADVDVAIGAPGVVMTGARLLSGVEAPGLTLLSDSDVGLYGVDVDEPFTASEAGVYRVVVQNFDSVTSAARVEVRSED